MSTAWLKDLFYRPSGSKKAPLPICQASRQQTWAVGILCSIVFSLLYIATMAPSLGMSHDTGELTTCCVIQGVPHSPGYPLFVALGWLANQLPFGDEPAYRINFLCALQVGLAMGFLGAGLTLASRPWPALIATLLAGTCSALWRQAVATEVFALHLLLLSVLLWLAVLWEFSEDVKRREIVLVASFVVGCCLAHQHMIALAGPAFLLFGVAAKGRGRAWGFTWMNLPILLATVLFPYLLQMYEAQQAPLLNWASPTDASRLWDHFLRKSYGTGLLNVAALEFDSRAGDAQVTALFISLVRSYFPFPSFVFLAFGLDRLCQGKAPPSAWLFCGLAFLYGPFFAVLGNQPSSEFYADLMERFYSGAVLGLAGLAALGLDWVFYYLRPNWVRFLPYLLLMPLYSGVSGYPKSSQRGMYHITDLMRASLRQLPPHSVFFVTGDLPGGGVKYLQVALGERRDILFVLPGLTTADWYLNGLPVKFARAAMRAKPGQTFITPETASTNLIAYLGQRGIPVYSNEAVTMEGEWVRVGLLYRYRPKGSAKESPQRLLEEQKKALELLESSPRRGPYQLDWRQNFWIRFCIDSWLTSYRETAVALAETDPALACVAMDRVLEMQMPQTFEAHINRAGLRLKLKRYQDAIQDYSFCLRVLPKSRMALDGMIQAQQGLGDQAAVNMYQLRLQELGPP